MADNVRRLYPEGVLSKNTFTARLVEDRAKAIGPLVTFEGARMEPVRIRRDDWHQMGRPEVITVTIEPGDKISEAVAERECCCDPKKET